MSIRQAVHYEVAKPSDAWEIVHLLATVFSESEPPAVAMGLSIRDMEQLLRLFAPGALAEGLTVVARDSDTGKLAGVLLTDDFAAPPALDLKQISAKFRPIFSMLESLDQQYHRGKTISAGECLHLFMLGVDGEFAGRGIAQGLVKACLENGIRRGYRMAVTEATGIVSQRVFRKQGFVDRFSVSYRGFKHEGKFVFNSIQGHESAILMDKSLL
ncbi:MAG: GNAT family N-acetyltransferase [Acidobacteriota bacterium]|nr:GNAT family N-acetyltransferase [Acidobacteriota bacterium]